MRERLISRRRSRLRSYEPATYSESRRSVALLSIAESMLAAFQRPCIWAGARAAGQSLQFRTGSETQRAIAHRQQRCRPANTDGADPKDQLLRRESRFSINAEAHDFPQDSCLSLGYHEQPV